MKTKNKAVLGLLLAAALMLAPGISQALELSVTLVIEGPDEEILNRTVPVADSCVITDTAGGIHTLSDYKAACALQSAKDKGYIADFEIINFSFGLWLDSINGIATTPDWSQGWALWLNDVPASVGVQGLSLSGGDKVSSIYGPWPSALLESNNSGPVMTDVFPRKLEVEEAVSFLVSHQETDGSFGSHFMSDWAAVALGAYEGKSATAVAAKDKLANWLKANPIPQDRVLTEYERRAMALLSLGMDPYEQGIMEEILSRFDGTQFGSRELVNDDIFALLVFKEAGYEENVTPLLETLAFILSWQRDSGSFGSPDLTSAAIQALSLVQDSSARNEALLKAREYLASQQESTGGFGNVYATSWALQAIAALDEDGDEWAMEQDRRTPEHFLALNQAQDGGLLKGDTEQNRVWATSYAVPAALGKSWGSVLVNVEQPQQISIEMPDFSEEPEGATEEELAALQETIESLEQRIAQLSETQQLEFIQQEVQRIAKETNELKPQVAALYSQYLASLPEEDRVLASGSQDLPVFDEIVEEEDQEEEVVLAQDQEDDQFAAAAAGTAPKAFFSTGAGQFVLALGTAIILFLVLGGWRTASSFFRRKATA